MKEANLQELRRTLERLTQLTGRAEARLTDLRMLLDAARQQSKGETQRGRTPHSDGDLDNNSDAGLSE